jgi:hypothetical protein
VMRAFFLFFHLFCVVVGCLRKQRKQAFSLAGSLLGLSGTGSSPFCGPAHLGSFLGSSIEETSQIDSQRTN